MKRTIPLLITALSGFILIVATFIPAWQDAGEEVTIWFDILAAIAFVLGGGNLLHLHLKKMSDQEPGWGYSAITLVSFLAMLAFGMLKLGSTPEPGMEAFGQSAVLLPLSSLPEFRIPGELPQRADGQNVRPSVRHQLRAENGELIFQGWMTPQQAEDLADYLDLQDWKCLAQRLFEAAQPPEDLKGRVRYSADQRKLFFTGRMTEEDRSTLKQTLSQTSENAVAVDTLFDLATRSTTHRVRNIPEGFAIPVPQQEVVSREGDDLQIIGPMPVPLRDSIVRTWSNPVMSRPLNAESRALLLNGIQQHGPLSETQLTAFNNFFDADRMPKQLVAVINIAGTLAPQPRTACEILESLNAGEEEPATTTPAPPPQVLNEAQQNAITEYVNSSSMLPAELTANLTTAGTVTPGQLNAISRFFDQQPTLADQRRALCFRLLEEGSLKKEQIDFLLDPIRQQFQWEQSVGELFIASQQVKYPWSGSYTAQGTPFWWLYEYVLQPLMTTTFALLAFYVASAAYRAFRAKNLEAVLLLGTAFLILIGRTSAGPALTYWLPENLAFLKMENLMVYIMSIFNTAGNRAIMIGIALGTIATSLRVLLGVDRSYLGSGD
ncbi:MAG TPA: hypothetical protein VNQ76_16910 [Planctomicrobium sp.]|nr:hypothetical protein [Planctomicrobium sp.]